VNEFKLWLETARRLAYGLGAVVVLLCVIFFVWLLVKVPSEQRPDWPTAKILWYGGMGLSMLVATMRWTYNAIEKSRELDRLKELERGGK
jgi:hypothetical protein